MPRNTTEITAIPAIPAICAIWSLSKIKEVLKSEVRSQTKIHN